MHSNVSLNSCLSLSFGFIQYQIYFMHSIHVFLLGCKYKTNIIYKCSELHDVLIIRPPVKNSLSLRISLLAFVMACGVLMYSINLKKISNFTMVGFIDIKVVEKPCEVPNVEK